MKRTRPTKSVLLVTDELPAAAEAQNLDSPSLFCNRELSLLAFQQRVLDEARDAANPLLERTNFLSILSSNLNEFFMVRVAVLKQRLATAGAEVTMDGLSAQEQLDAIAAEVTRIEKMAYQSLSEDLLPALAAAGVRVLAYESLGKRERIVAEAYFRDTVFPVLTPLAVDPARPFPHISNLSLNLAVLVKDPEGEKHFARVKVPPRCPSSCLSAVPAHPDTVQRSSGWNS